MHGILLESPVPCTSGRGAVPSPSNLRPVARASRGRIRSGTGHCRRNI